MRLSIFCFFLLLLSQAFARGVYKTSQEFLGEVFEHEIPKTRMIWNTADTRKLYIDIMGEKPVQLRTRYWKKDAKTAFILEEIGKEKPITVGLLVNNNQLERVEVLAFRETRGWEIKEAFFIDQFRQAKLNADLQLDRPIDGISGATLSVRAIKKLARLALMYNQQITRISLAKKDVKT